jgi:hypothetical protein
VPVRDDGAPYSLQPLLQRTPSVSLHVDMGHFETNDPFGSPLRTDWDCCASDVAKRDVALIVHRRQLVCEFGVGNPEVPTIDDVGTGGQDV